MVKTMSTIQEVRKFLQSERWHHIEDVQWKDVKEALERILDYLEQHEYSRRLTYKESRG